MKLLPPIIALLLVVLIANSAFIVPAGQSVANLRLWVRRYVGPDGLGWQGQQVIADGASIYAVADKAGLSVVASGTEIS